MKKLKNRWMVCLAVLMLFAACDSSSTRYFTLNVNVEGGGRVSSSPSGIDCSADCSADFARNTDVTLRAEAESGSEFKGWEGDVCNGTEDCTVRMDQAYTVTALFEKAADTGDSITLRNAGTFRTGIFDEGASEIAAYDPESGRIFVVNGADKAVDILQAADSGSLLSDSSRIGQISIAAYGGGVNSVAVSGGIVAAAVENEDKQQPGKIVFFDTDGNYLNEVAAGALPDMVVFTPDGSKVLTANEGEPSDDYSTDPEGSVTIADLSAGVANVTSVTVGFTAFNDRADELKAAGVRIFGPNATVAQDTEPEYIAVSSDSSRAWIALQENNAVAVLDIANAEITDIFPLGFKNHNIPNNGLDASDKDSAVNIRNWPVYGMYQPDSIAVYEVNGSTWLVSANEGDSRDYDGFSEESSVADVTLDPTVFPDAAELQKDENLGRLNITDTLGDTDGDGDFDALYAFGARSFTVWKVTDTGLEAVFDSGEEFERITAQRYPDYFNAGNDNNKFDNRSDNKGPEPEGIAIGQAGTRTYAFIALERMGGIMVYDITEPERAVFTDYILNRDFTQEPESADAGDLGPEGLLFVPAADSHTGKALLIAANEISGSTAVYEIESKTTFPLTLLHVNDTHSHLEPVNTSLMLDDTQTYLDLGGYARLATKVKAVRSENPNTLVLHAGDAVQGTLYFTKYEGKADFALLNGIGFDAMVTGNHEFDKGPELLSDMIDMADFPIIAANMDASNEPFLAGKIPPYIIREIGGTRVGIIGLITPETSVISSPGSNIIFLNEINTAQQAVQELESQGISKIIVLSHMGYEEDIALAEAVEGIDVIVGGHSHTLLGDVTDLGLTPAGPYPTRIYKKSGQDVCIVQSWEWAKAAGVLNLRFDDRGHIRFCRGDAVLLAGDSFQQRDADGNKADVSAEVKNELLSFIAAHPAIEVVSEDTGIAALLSPYTDGIEDMNQEVVAQVSEDLLHIRVPGTHTSGAELSDGSLIAPLVAEGMLWKARSTGLNVRMSLQNAGGVRIDIPQGDLTVGKSYELLPFGNTLYILELTGAEIMSALQNGVTRSSGAFPYVGGARYTVIDGQVRDVQIRNADGEWEDVNDDTVCLVATNAYLAGGGDGYTVLAQADGYRYDTGFGDAEVFIEYARTLGTLHQPEETGVIWEPAPQNLTLKIIETTDIHGSLFPYDFIEDKETDTSLAHIMSYVKAQRADSAQEVILLDNGDILQGQPIVNYYNFEKDLTQEMHIVAQVMNYMGYDAGTVGNHDIEPGHAVYDELVKQFDFPWLSANAMKEDGKPYFTPYTVLERQGVKIAILGLTTPGIPMWLPESLWSGMTFEDMVRSAQYWVPYIQENEKPDLLIGLFHSGFDYTYNGQDEYTEFNENGAQLVAMNVPGFDIIFIGHDHADRNETVNGTLILGGKNDARSAPTATVQMSWNESTQSYEKTVSGELPDLSIYTADADMMTEFSDAVNEVKAYVSQEVGIFTRSVSSRDAMFGDSAFTDIIHQLQFDVVAEHLDPAGADISFCAPLQFDKTIEAGSVYVRDMYKLYRYENQLFLMQMSGQEIKDYLEFNYDKWMAQMENDTDHLIHFTEEPEYNDETGTWTYQTATRYYNYDSAAGIRYTVDVSKAAGQRVNIVSMEDGSPFDPNAQYRVAINSYRGNGGGGHMTTGAGIENPDTRMLARTERDLRYYLMESIRKQGSVTPEALGNWSVIPENWALAGAVRDFDIFYGNPTFAVFSDPHYYDTALGTSGAAFEAYLAQDRKMLRESPAILDAVLTAITADKSQDFVLIPGDLTKDGELSSHQAFAEKLKTLEDQGIKVYVVPGNHDVNNPHAYAYADTEEIPTDTVSPETFAEIYGDFGYDEALYWDTDSLSYIAEPAPGLWLFALDSCRYDENLTLGKPVTSGRFSETTLNWILTNLEKAQIQGKKVMAMMHHGLLEHFTGQSQANPGSEYVIESWGTVSETLAKAGLSLVFTGHFHAQDITSETWESDGKTYTLTDVETGSLVTYPSPFRKVTRYLNDEYRIESQNITEISYDTAPLTFAEYAEDYLESGLYDLARYSLTLPADQGGYGIPAQQAEMIAPMITDAFKAHYTGNENPSGETLAAISTFLGSSDPTTLILGQTLYSLWTDPEPDDLTTVIGSEQ